MPPADVWKSEPLPEEAGGQRHEGKRDEVYGDEEPGPTVVYEGCLKPLLISIAIDGSEADLQRVFGFLESLSNDENWKVRELVRFSVYDLCRNSSALKKAIPFYWS